MHQLLTASGIRVAGWSPEATPDCRSQAHLQHLWVISKLVIKHSLPAGGKGGRSQGFRLGNPVASAPASVTEPSHDPASGFNICSFTPTHHPQPLGQASGLVMSHPNQAGLGSQERPLGAHGALISGKRTWCCSMESPPQGQHPLGVMEKRGGKPYFCNYWLSWGC